MCGFPEVTALGIDGLTNCTHVVEEQGGFRYPN